MEKKVIINADDLGMSKEINNAITLAFRQGILTSASIMATMPAYDDAVTNTIRMNHRLGVGIHLSVTEGKSILSKNEIPHLVDKNGVFKNSFTDVLMKSKSGIFLREVYAEMNAQFNKVDGDGIKIDHVNGHRHIHMIPGVCTVVGELAKRNGCEVVRVADERFSVCLKGMGIRRLAGRVVNGNIFKKVVLSMLARSNRRQLKNIRSPDYCYGVLDSGKMDTRTLRYILSCVRPGISEIITHPGIVEISEPKRTEGWKMIWAKSRGRQMELEALLAEEVRDEVERNNIRLIGFGV